MDEYFSLLLIIMILLITFIYIFFIMKEINLYNIPIIFLLLCIALFLNIYIY